MADWVLITAMIAAYLGLTLFVGLRAGRGTSATVTGFVAGDRNFGFLVMYFVTGATVFSAFAFLGGPGWAYSRGAAAFYILSYGVLGMVPWYVVGPKVARIGRQLGHVTQGQFLTGRFPSRFLSVLIVLISVAALIPYITLQMRGAGIVVEAVTEGHVPLWAGAAIAYGIVLIYVLVSGVAAVGWTNTLQGVFMIVIAWALGLYLPYALYGGIGPMFEAILAERPELLATPGLTAGGEPWTWGGYTSAILISAIGLTMWPHLFMKAFTARDGRIIQRTVVWFPTFQLFLLPVFLIGFAGVLFVDELPRPDFILPYLILNVDLPLIVVGLFCAGALSASMSTGDALLHATASVAVEDGVRPFVDLDEARQRQLIRLLVLAAGGVAYYFAVAEGISLVVLLLTSYGIIAQLAPPVLAALFWSRATTPGAIAGLLAGAATALLFFFQPDWRPFGIHEGLLGLMVHVPVLVIVSLLTPAQPAEQVRAYLSPATAD
ncbi:sodium:solute symporter family protein [Wenzhouxiangella marina]|uniref:Pantothenate permease n=1 Tax=Wenzhouxiangella marina TaxID=1579979 RepID=A0A0K0XY58_9GAMM|nr:sodium:solute symporter family protein [Wenzhouxiangella marina]AKS42562.1 Pantothenate permease [Wenzhouxiangella marina]MBB6085656.1 SSS family solute:Na+ symporter [Wenzhouxiangella marina]